MRLSDNTSLNIENVPSRSQEVTGTYLSKEMSGENEPVLNFIAVSKHAASSVFSFNFWPQSCNEGELQCNEESRYSGFLFYRSPETPDSMKQHPTHNYLNFQF